VLKNHIRRAVLTAALFTLLLPAAGAQGLFRDAEQTGTITGTVDGVQMEWRTVETDTEEGPQGSAHYVVMLGTMYDYTLQGHQGDSLVEGAIAIVFSSFTGPVADCPCQLTGEINYWTTSSAFNDLYLTTDAVITVHEAEEVSEGIWRLVGTAEGQLDYYESLMRPEPSGEPVPVMLEFEIDRVRGGDLEF